MSLNLRVLQVGSDRSRRGILQRGSAAFLRQEAYAEYFGNLDIIAFTLRTDGFQELDEGALRLVPTNSFAKWAYPLDARSLARSFERPAVVSAQDPFESGLAALFIARRFGVPLHVQVHTDFLAPAYTQHSWLNRVRVHIARYVLKRASGVRVVSDQIKCSLKSESWQLQAEPTVLPVYADIPRIKALAPHPGLSAHYGHFRTKVLVVARLEPEKRVSLALDAFARSAPEDACLIIVGEGSERAQLEWQAKELGIAHKVFFAGGLEAAPYYHIADVVLVPSEYEGYGLVIVEALGMGKPVICTDVGIAREAGATIITPPALFAEALRNWFDHGPREGVLKLTSFDSFDAYVRAYCNDIARLAHVTK